MSICSELFDFFCKVCRGNAQSICLASCINISENKMICVRESLGKLVEECLGTGISVGLKNTPYFIVRIVLSSL